MYVLDQIDMRETDWRAGDYQTPEEIRRRLSVKCATAWTIRSQLRRTPCFSRCSPLAVRGMCAVFSEAATLPLIHRDAGVCHAVLSRPSLTRRRKPRRKPVIRGFLKKFHFFENFVPQIPEN